MFFVLSGFLVGGSLLRAYKNASWSWRSYLTHRLVRLWIVLIPALLIGLLWDMLTIHIGKASVNPAVMHRVAATVASLNLSTFFANLGFLQRTLTPEFGSNGALWSLNNEFWYYVMFPLGFFALVPRYNDLLRVFFATALAILLPVLGHALVLAGPIWLIGVLLFYLPKSTFSETQRRVAMGIYVVAFLALKEVSFQFPLATDYLLGVATCAMLWVILSDRSAAVPTRRSDGIRLLAKFSYTLYLIHIPIFTFVGVCLVKGQPWQPTFPHLACAFGVWLATILFAFAIASVTEFHTDTVRRSVERWAGW